MDLDTESLRTLLAVLDHGGMTPAAQRLDLSQSAVSWRIKRLEQKVGQQLILRDGHTIRPSRACREILDEARSIVEAHDRAVRKLRSSELIGDVRVGAIEDVGISRLTSILGTFQRVHSRTNVRFVISPTEELSDQVEDGEIDLAIIQVSEHGLRAEDHVLWTDELVWARSATYPQDESPVQLITFGELCFYRPLSVPLLTAAGVEHRVAFSIPSTRGVIAAVEDGLGVAVLARHHLGDSMVEWEPPEPVSPLPKVHQVVRTVPGERSDVTSALLTVIADHLAGPPDFG